MKFTHSLLKIEENKYVFTFILIKPFSVKFVPIKGNRNCLASLLNAGLDVLF